MHLKIKKTNLKKKKDAPKGKTDESFANKFVNESKEVLRVVLNRVLDYTTQTADKNKMKAVRTEMITLGMKNKVLDEQSVQYFVGALLHYLNTVDIALVDQVNNGRANAVSETVGSRFREVAKGVFIVKEKGLITFARKNDNVNRNGGVMIPDQFDENTKKYADKFTWTFLHELTHIAFTSADILSADPADFSTATEKPAWREHSLFLTNPKFKDYINDKQKLLKIANYFKYKNADHWVSLIFRLNKIAKADKSPNPTGTTFKFVFQGPQRNYPQDIARLVDKQGKTDVAQIANS